MKLVYGLVIHSGISIKFGNKHVAYNNIIEWELNVNLGKYIPFRLSKFCCYLCKDTCIIEFEQMFYVEEITFCVKGLIFIVCCDNFISI